MSTLSDNELKAIAINAMGRSSEAGSLPVMQLGLAGSEKEGKAYPIMRSGYSLGFFQWDFGNKDSDASSAKALVNAYNDWAKNSKKPEIKDIDATAKLLHLHGQSTEKSKIPETDALYGKEDFRGTETGKNINAFLASDKGYEFNFSLQEKHYETDLKPKLNSLMKTKAIQNMNENDTRVVMAALAKVKNQAGNVPGSISKILDSDKTTKDDVLQKIYDTYPQQTNKKGEKVDHVVTQGVKHTVKGAELYNTLASDQGELGKAFRTQIKDDPTLVKTGFKTQATPQIIDALFRNPSAAHKLIDAVNHGKSYQIDNHTAKIKDEAYTVGVTQEGTLYSVDKNGKGHSKAKEGQWTELANLKDIDVLWAKSPTIYHRGSKKSDGILQLQKQLNQLGIKDAAGNALTEDKGFGQRTAEAVKNFQKQHKLKATGIVDQNTLDKINDATKTLEKKPELSKKEEMFNRLAQSANSGNRDQLAQAVKSLSQSETGKQIQENAQQIRQEAQAAKEVENQQQETQRQVQETQTHHKGPTR